MVYFTDIKKTNHYKEHHERQVPWFEVLQVIATNHKNMKKKENMLEIETEKYYILGYLDKKVLMIVNAKRK